MRLNNGERRQANMMQSIILPVFVAVITGGLSSYFGVVVAVSVIETKLFYIETNVNTILDVSKQASINKTELVRRGMWIESVEKRLDNLESKNRF